MDQPYDYKKFAILYVDDEEKSLKNFVRAFEEQFRILTAPNAQEGLRLLQANQASIGLHETMGFTPIGVYREVGWKMGGWRDVGWWQRLL